MGDDRIDIVILDIDMGYLVTLVSTTRRARPLSTGWKSSKSATLPQHYPFLPPPLLPLPPHYPLPPPLPPEGGEAKPWVGSSHS